MTTKIKIALSESEYTDYCNDSCGICLNCEELAEGGVEPDAEGYICDACGEPQVMGLEHALVAGHVDITDADEDEENHGES